MTVPTTHADRFPEDGITKGEIVEHYRRVAAVMLPRVRERPLTLLHYPRGIGAKGFIQQDIADSGAPVATAIGWDELTARGLRADRYTVRSLPRRLAEHEDPWRDLRRQARSLSAARRRLDRLPG